MFISKMRADDGDRSPWGDFWFQPAPGRSGGIVSSDQALRLTAVYRCVRLLSEALSLLPIVVYRPRADGGKDLVRDHWLYRLMAVRPNRWQNPVQWRSMMQAHLELRGNAYARIYANSRGEVTDLVPIHPDCVTIEMLANDDWRYRIRNRDGSETVLNREQMFHRRDLTLDGIVGLNPVQAAREAIETGLAAQSYGRRFFQNNAVPNGWVELARSFATDDDRRKWATQLNETMSGRNQGKLAVLENGDKFHAVEIKNSDAQFIESKKYTVTDIARLYGVPPHKVGDLEKSAFANIEQQSLDFVNDAVAARANNWAAALKFDFVEDDDTLQVYFPTDILLRADSAARAGFKQKAITSGWMSRNEARVDEGLNPLPGLDEPLRPLNMAPESEADAQQENEQNNGNQPRKPGAVPDARLQALSSAAAERIARKETQMVMRALREEDPQQAVLEVYQNHVEFVRAALGISNQAAQAYCEAQSVAVRLAPKMPVEHFEAAARAKLERMALGQ